MTFLLLFFFFSSRRRHTRYWRDWSSDVCSSDLWELVPWIGRSSLAICVRPWINFRFPKKNDLKSLLLSKARGPPSLKNNMKSRRNKKETGYFSGAKRAPRCPGCGVLWPFLGEIELKQEADVLRPMPGHH